MRVQLILVWLGLFALVSTSSGCGAPDSSWPVDEFFEGAIGQSLGDNGLIRWFRLHDDGTWEYGARGCGSEPETLLASGTWTFSVPDDFTEVRLDLTEGEEYPGSLGAGATEQLFLRYEECEGAVLIKVQTEDEALSYSRGRACVQGCSASTPRVITWCDGAPAACL